MIVKRLPRGTYFCWIDADHFVSGKDFYRLIEIKNRGRLLGEFFWLDETTGELHRSTTLTETGLADSRPPTKEIAND